MIKKTHLWIGIIGIILFLLSGQYFQHVLNELIDLNDVPRLLLRSSHVYFFFASFINLVFGLYYVPPPVIKWYVICNQALLMLSPVLIGYGFIFETITNTGIDRQIGSLGVVMIFVWLVTTMMVKILEKYCRDNSEN